MLFVIQKAFKMKTDMISIRIDHGTKLEFTQVCEDIGLSPSQAIKLFAKAVINYGGIPFELRKKQPNRITMQAIQELEEGKGHKIANSSALFNEFQVKLDND
jgi:DNA-damage-inducible protein J